MKISTKKGRPRSFDEAHTLEQSMTAFWKHGFFDTNYGVLEQVTGLRRQSIIYAFGDKRSLFLKSLSHYLSTSVSQVVAILEGGGSDLGNIRKVFDVWVDMAEDKNKRGCLIVNTSGQFGVSDEDIATLVNEGVNALRCAFTAAYQSAQDSGEAITAVSADDLARLTVAAGNGALLHVHSDEDPEQTIKVLESLWTMVSVESHSAVSRLGR